MRIAARVALLLLAAGLCVTVNSDDPAYFGGYVAENYLALHPNQPYIVMHDMPKLAALPGFESVGGVGPAPFSGESNTRFLVENIVCKDPLVLIVTVELVKCCTPSVALTGSLRKIPASPSTLDSRNSGSCHMAKHGACPTTPGPTPAITFG